MFKFYITPCSITRRMIRRRSKTFGIIFFLTTTLFLFLNELLFVTDVSNSFASERGNGSDSFKTILLSAQTHHVKESPKKILLWTTFFGEMKWYEESKNVYKDVCHSDCILTDDKSQISSADAVVFHLNDITWQGQLETGFSFSFPKYRHPDQVWILYNIEPVTMVWGNMAAWQGVFNWTFSYSSNSDVHAPYGAARELTQAEKKDAESNPEFINTNYYSAKSKYGAIAMISHCTDDARRYKIIQRLKKYIPAKVIGKCGEPCPDGYLSCNQLLGEYRFYLAFENSDCLEYVSEKYWRSLMRGQIPVVAWRTPMQKYVIPGSYINVIDFPSIDEAGRYIQQVNSNQTLYNSYFKWKFTHTILQTNGWCLLCEILRKGDKPHMVYHDMHGWIHNNTCQPVTLPKLLKRKFERFFYDFRF